MDTTAKLIVSVAILAAVVAGGVAYSQYAKAVGMEESATQADDLRQKVAEKDKELHARELLLEERDRQLRDKNEKIKSLQRQAGTLEAEKKELQDNMESRNKQMIADLKKEIKDKNVRIEKFQKELRIQLLNRILFASGSAEIAPAGQKALKKIANGLQGLKNRQVMVVGHTDNKPINSAIATVFPSNWELSTARASAVVKSLLENSDIDPAMIVAAGRADNVPLQSNETKEGRAQNRRVEIVISPILKKADSSK